MPDEAATATALLCGIKSKSDLVATTATAIQKNCYSGKGQKVRSVLEDAFRAGEDFSENLKNFPRRY